MIRIRGIEVNPLTDFCGNLSYNGLESMIVTVSVAPTFPFVDQTEDRGSFDVSHTFQLQRQHTANAHTRICGDALSIKHTSAS